MGNVCKPKQYYITRDDYVFMSQFINTTHPHKDEISALVQVIRQGIPFDQFSAKYKVTKPFYEARNRCMKLILP